MTVYNMMFSSFRKEPEPGYTGPLGFSSSLLSVSGENASWSQQTINISTYASATVRVVFWYLKGSSFTGDIQLDDIAIDGTTYDFESGTHSFICNNGALAVGTSITTYPSTMSVAPLATGDSTAIGIWLRDLGGTGSSSTGLTVDHTLGTTSGYYVYAETSGGQSTNRPFFLATPEITLSSNPGNMTFWEARYGATIGTLYVYMYVVSA